MIIIDIETGDYKVDKNGLHAADYLSGKHPNARLLRLLIEYKVAASLASVIERFSK